MAISINDLIFLSEGYCYSCKNELYSKKYFCKDCLSLFEYVNGIKYFGEYKCYYPYLYTGKIKELIGSFKFYNHSYLYRAFGELLVDYIKEIDLNFDCIIPTPISRRKLSKRGYNQTELLADYIGEILKVEVLKDAVIKKKNTKDQHLLSIEKRATNLKNSFELINKNLGNKKILILDDIVTSGYTLKEVASVFERNGNRNIEALVIASSKIESKFKVGFKSV